MKKIFVILSVIAVFAIVSCSTPVKVAPAPAPAPSPVVQPIAPKVVSAPAPSPVKSSLPSAEEVGFFFLGGFVAGILVGRRNEKIVETVIKDVDVASGTISTDVNIAINDMEKAFAAIKGAVSHTATPISGSSPVSGSK